MNRESGKQISQLQREIEQLNHDNDILIGRLLSEGVSGLVRKLYDDVKEGSDSQYTKEERILLDAAVQACSKLQKETPLDFFQSFNDTLLEYDSNKAAGQALESVDPTIARFLDSQRRRKSRRKQGSSGLAGKQKELVLAKLREQELINDVIEENLQRLVGITAFPVADPAFAAESEHIVDLTSDDEDNSGNEGSKYLLGIRFDTYNERSRKFEPPHYIILKYKMKNNQRFIFKHTIPHYINVQQLAAQYLNRDLFRFVKTVYSRLALTLRKKILIESLVEEHSAIELVDIDLGCSQVVFHVAPYKVEISINYTEIAAAQVLLARPNLTRIDSVKKLRAESALKGTVFDLTSKFNNVLQILNPEIG